jgi:hypothetical protein
MELGKEAIGLAVGALIIGALAGYFAFGGTQSSQLGQLQTQIAGLQTQVSNLQSQLNTAQSQLSEKNTQIALLQAEIARLTALVPPEPPKEGELGSSRFFPAPIGTAIPVVFIYDGGQYSAKITVKQIIRGDLAWGMIYDANSYNDPPPTGYEYILVKVRFELTSAPTVETAFEVHSYRDLKAVSGLGRIYDTSLFLVLPQPKLDATIYQGAYSEGWCAFLIEKTDTNPMMVFARRADGTGGIWLKLYP